MTIITRNGAEVETDNLTIGDNPKRISILVKNMSILEAATLFCTDNALPIKGYEEYDDIVMIGKARDRAVTVVLRPQNSGGF